MTIRERVALAVFAAAILLLGFGAPYVPVDYSGISRDDAMVMHHSERETLVYARMVLFWLGGIPPDAHLLYAGELAAEANHEGHYGAPQPFDAEYECRPDHPYSTDDRIVIIKQEHHGTLYPSMIFRRWHPAWWRRSEQARMRSQALVLPQPQYVQASCPRGADLHAALRVLGTQLTYDAYGDNLRRVPRGDDFLSTPGVLVRWRTPVMLVVKDPQERAPVFRQPVWAAWISNAPDASTPFYRYAELKAFEYVRHRWMWLRFSVRDTEPVCR